MLKPELRLHIHYPIKSSLNLGNPETIKKSKMNSDILILSYCRKKTKVLTDIWQFSSMNKDNEIFLLESLAKVIEQFKVIYTNIWCFYGQAKLHSLKCKLEKEVDQWSNNGGIKNLFEKSRQYNHY